MIFHSISSGLASQDTRLSAGRHSESAKIGNHPQATASRFKSLLHEARQAGITYGSKISGANAKAVNRLKSLPVKVESSFNRLRLEVTGVAKNVRQLRSVELDELQKAQDDQADALWRKLNEV